MTGSDFWSRRKAAVEAEEQAADRSREEAERASREDRDAARSDQEILDELNLPDPDALERGDDFRAFLASAVPERLRRRALRRLWRLDPALANLDGLVEYGEDYTAAGTVLDKMATGFRAGKGMINRMSEPPASRVSNAPDIGAEPPETQADEAERDPVEMAANAPELLPDPGEEAAGTAEIQRNSYAKAPRMRYTFKP